MTPQSLRGTSPFRRRSSFVCIAICLLAASCTTDDAMHFHYARKDRQRGEVRLERVNDSLHVLRHSIGGIPVSEWELPYPVYRMEGGDLTGDGVPEIAVGKKFVFRAEPEWAEDLRRAGITHAALANNHTIDQGREGLADTYHALRKAGITPLGYGRTADEQAAPVVIRKGSLEVALFNTIPLPIENWPQAEGKPDICRMSVRRLAAVIRKYKAAHPGTRVVAVLHWGTEFQPVPDMQQRYDARLLAQAGADAIVGHHPHVPQPADSVGSAPVFYSLGNFVFDPIHPAAQKAAMALLRFTPAGMEAETIPVEIRRCRPQMTQKTLSLP